MRARSLLPVKLNFLLWRIRPGNLYSANWTGQRAIFDCIGGQFVHKQHKRYCQILRDRDRRTDDGKLFRIEGCEGSPDQFFNGYVLVREFANQILSASERSNPRSKNVLSFRETLELRNVCRAIA